MEIKAKICVLTGAWLISVLLLGTIILKQQRAINKREALVQGLYEENGRLDSINYILHTYVLELTYQHEDDDALWEEEGE